MIRSRRGLLLTMVNAGVALSCGGLAHDAWSSGPAPLDALLADPAAARTLGRRVLAQVPGCALAAAATARELATVAGGSPARLHEELARRVGADFAGDRVLVVDGWVLARSEALLCAALAL
jgi:hypothetical protein